MCHCKRNGAETAPCNEQLWILTQRRIQSDLVYCIKNKNYCVKEEETVSSHRTDEYFRDQSAFVNRIC